MRGQIEQLPKKVVENSKKYFKEFTQKHLRFLPYLQYLAVNSGKVDIRKIDDEERQILQHLKQVKVVDGGASEPITIINKDFWDFINDCLYYAHNNDFAAKE